MVGITAVAGNVPLALTQKNARIVCELAGRSDIKVFAGASRRWSGHSLTAEHVHGKTGLDGPVLPDPQMPLQEMNAVDFIVETVMSEPEGSITLCPDRPADQHCPGPGARAAHRRPNPRNRAEWGAAISNRAT